MRGLSKEQVPVLLATPRGGATAGKVLDTVTKASLEAVLTPILAGDAVLVSDRGRAYPGCARRLGGQHEAVNVSAGIRVRGSYHVQTVNSRHRQWCCISNSPDRGESDCSDRSSANFPD